MSQYFEELDYAPTPIGAVSLRRRHVFALGVDALEIMLGDEHLMSDIFVASELALGNLGVEACAGDNLDVLVGGLGLGYTAQAVLEHERVANLAVVDFLEPVIRWHETGLVPLEPKLKDDERCSFVQGDFFAMAKSDAGFDAANPGRQYDAILIDIDHTPDRLLNRGSNPETQGFYTTSGLGQLAKHIKAGGVMGLWSDEAPDDEIIALIASAFDEAWAAPVEFTNPLQENRLMVQTVYLGRKAAG